MKKSNDWTGDYVAISKQDYHRMKYFGNSLNKLIDRTSFGAAKMDFLHLVLFDEDKKRVRIIESKNDDEPINPDRLTLLKLMKKSMSGDNGYKVDVFCVRGNEPYDTAEIEDIDTGRKKQVTKDQLLKLLNFEI